MLSNIGSGELIIIAVIALIFFGGKKMKELAHGMGEATREMKKIQDELTSEGGGDK